MVDIQEIPLDIDETTDNNADTEIIEDNVIEDIPAPKKKGRPAGAKNKAKAVIKPPVVAAKAIKKEKPVEPKNENESWSHHRKAKKKFLR